MKHFKQCCGSVTFRYGSGSADPHLWLTDPDSDQTPDLDPTDPYLWLKDPDLDLTPHRTWIRLWIRIRLRIWLRILLFSSMTFKIKSHREVTKQYYYCLIIEGSGAGSVYHTNGSGSAWIRIFWLSWILIRSRNVDPDPVRAKDTIVYDFYCTTNGPLTL
jgi:hypothetical protein